MDAQAAARLGDEIAHGFGLAAMIGGAVVGALIGAAIVGATVATGGAALAIMAGSIAAGGLSMFQIVKGLSTLFKLPEPTTGVLIRGSFDVYINSRNAMRAGADVSAVCSGQPMNHPVWPFPVLIAEGSATVYINGKPAARLQSKMVCGAHIKSGSENTFIGGPTLGVAFVLDLEGWMHTGLEALGLLAAGGALVLAAMAGLAALGTALLVGATAWGGMALLGELGDRLGAGYRDLLQGVAGMALLGMGPKLAKLGKPNAAKTTAGEELGAAKTATDVTLHSAEDIRFSQKSVSYSKVDRATGKSYTYDDLVESMRSNGWKGDPVDVIKMPDGKLTSMDNTRIAAAREAGVEVQARVRSYDEPLTLETQEARGWQSHDTWGEALTGRINKQSGSFATDNPYGSPNPPRISGGGKK
jgi:uncharacterized Zn-binding protein involved in type VI secretion